MPMIKLNCFDEEWEQPIKCFECDFFDFRFETNSMIQGYCLKKKKMVEGTLDLCKVMNKI